jgi:hypothetical protein
MRDDKCPARTEQRDELVCPRQYRSNDTDVYFGRRLASLSVSKWCCVGSCIGGLNCGTNATSVDYEFPSRCQANG